MAPGGWDISCKRRSIDFSNPRWVRYTEARPEAAERMEPPWHENKPAVRGIRTRLFVLSGTLALSGFVREPLTKIRADR